MNAVLDELLDDLAAESHALRAIVADLPDASWRTPTPAEGWDVATQIAHLAWTDETSVVAGTDKTAWDAVIVEALADIEGFVDARAVEGARLPPSQLLARWDASRAAVAEMLRAAEGKIAWFGPPMSPASMATARFMETWAHSLDVHDALGVTAERTDRVRHVCHLGVRTRGFAYAVRSLDTPREDIYVELHSPTGQTWQWGSEDAAQSVTGPAWDFARLVTQRVHRDDTALVAQGADADQWLSIAQAFAGPPGKGRDRA